MPHASPAGTTPRVAVVGGGPSGLIAAETLAAAGCAVTVFDAMPSVGRKFLLAGRGGLNLTHGEPLAPFLERYGERRAWLAPMIAVFGPAALREWAHELGVDTFVGSSGRVFPTEMKAAPLLRAWLARLRAAGVRFAVRHRWLGWADEAAGALQRLRFATPDGERIVEAEAVLLALGGGSWAKLGSDGAWVPLLRAAGAEVVALQPANCGFDVAAGGEAGAGWSAHFLARFRGQPMKSVVAHFEDADGRRHERAGECLISATGIEGGLIYALSAPLRDTIAAHGSAILSLDLAPGRSEARLAGELARPRGSRSMASHLQGQAGIKGLKAGLLRECLPRADFEDPARLAAGIKALPLKLVAPRPLDEAISSAGGVRFESIDDGLMLRARPGVFVAGEMLDWEAPTGGYLLTACFATGLAAGKGVARWLEGWRRGSVPGTGDNA
ncbi:MAG: TIGR03862 family flavoprotein [Thauera phenolivorans]|uniref:TIGR03862 family flavoprotein n=1 Tax=Thauera phenolivorans TaxID=1792543 RepID=A0A7X7LY57_9RHOO|nr:TIGR03862 family flavoprotein [Thauera phenolivorans]